MSIVGILIVVTKLPMFLQNVGNYLQDYTVSQHRKSQSTIFLPWESQLSNTTFNKMPLPVLVHLEQEPHSRNVIC